MYVDIMLRETNGVRSIDMDMSDPIVSLVKQQDQHVGEETLYQCMDPVTAIKAREDIAERLDKKKKFDDWVLRGFGSWALKPCTLYTYSDAKCSLRLHPEMHKHFRLLPHIPTFVVRTYIRIDVDCMLPLDEVNALSTANASAMLYQTRFNYDYYLQQIENNAKFKRTFGKYAHYPPTWPLRLNGDVECNYFRQATDIWDVGMQMRISYKTAVLLGP
jgi:hypothetical protein